MILKEIDWIWVCRQQKILRVKQIQQECKLNIKKNLNQMTKNKFKIVYNLLKNSLFLISFRIHLTFQQVYKGKIIKINLSNHILNQYQQRKIKYIIQFTKIKVK